MKELSEQTINYLQTMRLLDLDLYVKMLDKLGMTDEAVLQKVIDIPEQKREVYYIRSNQTEAKQNIELSYTEEKKAMAQNTEEYEETQESVDECLDERNHGEYDSEDEIKGNEEKTVFERYFLVDYENVNRKGLNGITKLTETDCVKIYYSENAETLTFGLHRRINESRAHFDYKKVRVLMKDDIDHQIVTDIQELIRVHRDAEYVIVSKDKDYDQAIEYFTAHKIKLKKVQEICKSEDKVSEEKEKGDARVRSFFGRHFEKKDYVDKKEEIIQLLLTSKTRQQVNNGLLKMYPNETVSKMLKTLQPLIKDLPGK